MQWWPRQMEQRAQRRNRKMKNISEMETVGEWSLFKDEVSFAYSNHC